MSSPKDATNTAQTQQADIVKLLGKVSVDGVKVDTTKLSFTDLVNLQNQLVMILGSAQGQLTSLAETQKKPLEEERSKLDSEMKAIEEKLRKTKEGARMLECRARLEQIATELSQFEVIGKHARKPSSGAGRTSLPRAEIAKRLLLKETPSAIAAALSVSVSGVNNIAKRWTTDGSTDTKPHYVERTTEELQKIAAGQ